jgi:hypothetical protein
LFGFHFCLVLNKTTAAASSWYPSSKHVCCPAYLAARAHALRPCAFQPRGCSYNSSLLQHTNVGHCSRTAKALKQAAAAQPEQNSGCTATIAHTERLGARKKIHSVCVFITAGPSTKLFAWGGGGYWGTCATRDDEPRPVWTSLLITH